jgi:hypothetical protein
MGRPALVNVLDNPKRFAIPLYFPKARANCKASGHPTHRLMEESSVARSKTSNKLVHC